MKYRVVAMMIEHRRGREDVLAYYQSDLYTTLASAEQDYDAISDNPEMWTPYWAAIVAMEDQGEIWAHGPNIIKHEVFRLTPGPEGLPSIRKPAIEI